MFTNPPKRKKNNSINRILDVLHSYPFISENEVMRRAFGYNRNIDSASNKKYADMLRRALEKGTIARVKEDVIGERAIYFYFKPDQFNPTNIKLFREIDKSKKFERGQIEETRGSQLMKDSPSVKMMVGSIVKHLNDFVIDGETLDFIIDELGFREYIDTKVINAIDSAFNKEIIRLFDEFLDFKGKIPFDELKFEIDNFLHHKRIKPKPVELTVEELIRIAEEKLGEPVKVSK